MHEQALYLYVILNSFYVKKIVVISVGNFTQDHNNVMRGIRSMLFAARLLNLLNKRYGKIRIFLGRFRYLPCIVSERYK